MRPGRHENERAFFDGKRPRRGARGCRQRLTHSRSPDLRMGSAVGEFLCQARTAGRPRRTSRSQRTRRPLPRRQRGLLQCTGRARQSRSQGRAEAVDANCRATPSRRRDVRCGRGVFGQRSAMPKPTTAAETDHHRRPEPSTTSATPMPQIHMPITLGQKRPTRSDRRPVSWRQTSPCAGGDD
jgi:hypothetical protein